MRVLREDHDDTVAIAREERKTLALWGKEWKLSDMVVTLRPGIVIVSSQLGAVYVCWAEVCKVDGRWLVRHHRGAGVRKGLNTRMEFEELEPALDWAGEFLRGAT